MMIMCIYFKEIKARISAFVDVLVEQYDKTSRHVDMMHLSSPMHVD